MTSLNAMAEPSRPSSTGLRNHLPDDKYLSFRLGVEEYGIDILGVQEIRQYAAPTRIANAPPFVLGVLNLRGVIVPIIDLRLKFGLSDVRYDGPTVTIVLTIQDRVMGMVVDAVSDVVQFARDQIKPPPDLFDAAETHIIGLGPVQSGEAERLLILLDIEALMQDADVELVPALA